MQKSFLFLIASAVCGTSALSLRGDNQVDRDLCESNDKRRDPRDSLSHEQLMALDDTISDERNRGTRVDNPIFEDAVLVRRTSGGDENGNGTDDVNERSSLSAHEGSPRRVQHKLEISSVGLDEEYNTRNRRRPCFGLCCCVERFFMYLLWRHACDVHERGGFAWW